MLQYDNTSRSKGGYQSSRGNAGNARSPTVHMVGRVCSKSLAETMTTINEMKMKIALSAIKFAKRACELETNLLLLCTLKFKRPLKLS